MIFPIEIRFVLDKGSARRATASTQMNAESSRSHLICSLVVKMTNRRNENTTVGKLTLVDLAGSEVFLLTLESKLFAILLMAVPSACG